MKGLTYPNFYVMGADASNKVAMRKIDFSASTVAWDTLMDCPDTGSCGMGRNEAILSTDGSTLHNAIISGGGTMVRLLYFTLDTTSGSLTSSVYESSID